MSLGSFAVVLFVLFCFLLWVATDSMLTLPLPASLSRLICLFSDIDQKNSVLRGNGLKVEQLKGELELMLHADHH